MTTLRGWLGLSAVLALSFWLGVGWLTASAATPAAPLVTPRPTLVPTATPTLAPPRPPTGALIQLWVTGTELQNTQTLVQWQDGLGQWHDVEGWRGTLEGGPTGRGWQTWWLAADLFGRGPFRWVVTPQNRPAQVSEGFYLPSGPGQVQLVEVRLP